MVVPIARRSTWDEVKSFSHAIADAMVHDSPGKYIATMSKARRHGKIYVDYLRNDRGATAIASYSTRARIGAPVSTPLAWDELSPGLNPTHFNTHSVPKRLESLREDPWKGFFETRQSLTRAMMDAAVIKRVRRNVLCHARRAVHGVSQAGVWNNFAGSAPDSPHASSCVSEAFGR